MPSARPVGLRIDAANWIDGTDLAIGNSMFLKELVLKLPELRKSPSHRLETLYRGISHNRTVQTLRLVGEDHCQILGADVFQILTPFFEYNRQLHTVRLFGFDLSQAFDSLVLALSKCNDEQLKCIRLADCTNHQHTERLFDALRNKGLMKLSFCDNYSNLDWWVCTALVNLITTSATSMRTLEFNYGYFSSAGFSIISDALSSCKNLEHLGLKDISFHCLPYKRYMDDECAIGLGDSLAVIDTLKSLNLGDSCRSITSAG